MSWSRTGILLLALASASVGAWRLALHPLDARGASCTSATLAPRSNAMLAYDPAGRRVLLVGGRTDDATDRFPRATWAWDGRGWSCVAADGPPGRTDGVMAHDDRRGRMVLYGGRARGVTGMTVFSDTWEFDGSRWTMIDSVGPPSPRIHPVMAYDRSRGLVLLHGGLGVPGPQQFRTDTWSWSGTRWSSVPIAGAPQAGDHHHALLAAREGPLLVIVSVDSASGCVSDARFQRGRARLHALRGASWVPVDENGPCFGGDAPTVWTPSGIVLYRSWNAERPSDAAETWRWSAGAWTRLDIASPPPRRGSRMAYDASRDRVVLHGGNDERGARGDTWEFDGRAWRQVAP